MANSLVKLTLESNQYEKGLRQAQKQWEQFTKGIGLSVSKFTAVGAAITAVSGALKVAKDAFFKNEQQLDEWGRTVEASKSLYSGFLNSINNGDISGFLSNINNITQAARDAYDALDELSTFNAFNQIQTQKARTGFTEAMAGFRMGEGTKESVQEAAKAYQDELRTRQKKEQEAYSQAVRKIAAERGVPWGNLEQALTGKYGDYEALKNTQPTGTRLKFIPGGMFGGSTAVEVPMAVTAQEKMGEALRQLNDTELKELQALGAQAQRTGEEIAQIDKQMARVLNARSKAGSSGSGGGGGGTTNIKTEQTYTMNAYTEALDKLATEIGLKGSQRSDFINMFKNKSYNELLTIKNKYDEGKAGRQLYYGDLVLGGKIQNRDTGVWREMEENEKKEFEFARALNQLNDEQIQATQALGKQAEMLDEAVWNRAYNRLAGNNAGKGGGSSKGGGGRVSAAVSNDSTYAIDSIAAQQAQVTELNKKWRESAETVRNDVLVQLIAAENKLKQMNNQATLFRENQEGKLLGGDIQTSGLGNITGIAGIGAGLSDEVMEKIRQMQLGGNNVKKSWESAASAVASVGSAMMGIQDPAAKIVGTIGQAVASIALGYATATAQAAEMGPLAWVAFAASGLAQMVSMIATIKSATGYAQGGIVDGNSYSGDNIPIMANAGEVVLTKAMQANLANQLDGGGMIGLGPSKISGEQIYIILNRYLKRSGQGELMTWG